MECINETDMKLGWISTLKKKKINKMYPLTYIYL